MNEEGRERARADCRA